MSRRITIFKTATGEICKTTVCPGQDVARQCGPGESYIHGAFNFETHFVDLHTKAPVQMPPRPTMHHQFDYARRRWVLDELEAWAEVRAERDRRIAASDWVILRATDQGVSVPPEWQTYRQALRDITAQGDPMAIVWPAPPV